MSAACTKEYMDLLLSAVMVLGFGFGMAGWYFGSNYGIWQERLSFNC
jgi:hypothetical protein